MAITIRYATPDDAARLAEVEVASWRTAYRGLMPDAYLDGISEAQAAAGWRASLEKHATRRAKRVLLAADGAAVHGFARVGAMEGAPGAGLVYLLYVRPSSWRQGVGTALMQAAQDDLRAHGMHESVLWVLRDNQRARAFYERLGWAPDGTVQRDDYGGVALEALRYRRRLDPC